MKPLNFKIHICFVVLLLIISYFLIEISKVFKVTYNSTALIGEVEKPIKKIYPPLDKNLYDQKINYLANNPKAATSSTSTPTFLWPTKDPYPLDGALLPFNRIVAYYGNFYSTRMGALGEYESQDMLRRLNVEVQKWKAADPSTPVIPAIHYIAVTAQGSPGDDGMYRLRMPDSQIEKALQLAKQANGIVFLDIQIGLSDFKSEIKHFEKYLKLPNVHLGLDPEFAMKTKAKPGTVIGTMDAFDINEANEYLAKLVRENNLPPKILVLHRFTRNMITNYKNIKKIPEVQIVIDMDGWGPKPNKITTYKSFITSEPIQFTGFKLFYKNDLKAPSTGLLTPEELLELRPRPIYIQYQ